METRSAEDRSNNFSTGAGGGALLSLAIFHLQLSVCLVVTCISWPIWEWNAMLLSNDDKSLRLIAANK